ncbi:MAG TPA: ACP S-malonyltransferase [Pirellulales bacterium]|jgi:[acyl-carrier-protein] S-malonyltransferase|nr:ACP S-malonyltransferase [Pirellulales bacterium]
MAAAAFLFPGQGAQMVGMGKAAYDALPAARDLFSDASALLGYDLAKLCFEGPAAELDSTVRSQPALFVCSLAALELLKSQAPETVAACPATAGLSLGEYTALVFAGVLEFADGLRVVQERGAAMQQAAERQRSGMSSILGLEREQVEQICDQARQGDVLQIANLLCPGNFVVSGNKAACERAGELAVAAGAMKVIPLTVAGAFHTPLMDSAVERLRAALSQVTLKTPRIPVISNVDAEPHHDPEEIRRLLIEQVVRPVRWEDSIRYLLSQGIRAYYEVGPGKVLKGLLKRIDRKLECENIG